MRGDASVSSGDANVEKRDPSVAKPAKFHSNASLFFCFSASVVRSYPPMAVARRTSTTAPAQRARPDQNRRQAVRSSRREELQAQAMRIGVVLSLFFVLVVAAVLIGGRSVTRPMLQAMAQPLDAHRKGAIFLPCRAGRSAATWPTTNRPRN